MCRDGLGKARRDWGSLGGIGEDLDRLGKDVRYWRKARMFRDGLGKARRDWGRSWMFVEGLGGIEEGWEGLGITGRYCGRLGATGGNWEGLGKAMGYWGKLGGTGEGRECL